MLSHHMQLVNACLFQMGRIDAEGNQIPEDKWKENCKWDDFDMQADCVCVIFDRDYRKLEESLDTIFDLCNQHRIKVIMSNPNFELWLLMHFPNLEQYSPKMLLDNKKNLRINCLMMHRQIRSIWRYLFPKMQKDIPKGAR